MEKKCDVAIGCVCGLVLAMPYNVMVESSGMRCIHD